MTKQRVAAARDAIRVASGGIVSALLAVETRALHDTVRVTRSGATRLISWR